MNGVEIIFAAIEGIKLLSSSIEAANIGDEAKAMKYLEEVRMRVASAEDAWEDSNRD